MKGRVCLQSDAWDGIRFEFDNGFGEEPLMLEGIRLHQIGELYCEAGFSIPRHEQWCHEISYIISGRGTFTFDGQAHAVKEDDLVITPLHCVHSIQTSGGDPLRFAYIGFDLDACTGEDYEALRSFYQRPPQLILPGRPDVLLAFTKCLEEFYHPQPQGELVIGGYVRQILVGVSRQAVRKGASPPIARGRMQGPGQAVYAALRYIEEHLFALPDIRAMAGELGYSHCYLSHVFRERTGMTLQQYIARKKAEKAEELLRHVGLPVGRVAEALGYASVQSFSAAFKRVRGVSPTAWMEE